MKVCYKHIIIYIITFSRFVSLGSEDSFDQAIQNLRNIRPELFEEKTEPAPSKATDTDSYETLDKIINAVALISALIRISYRYCTLNKQTNDETSILNKILKYIVPSFVSSLHIKTILIKNAGIITLETIVYKTIAKMLVYCAKGDVYDLTKKLLCKIKAIVLW